MFTGLSAVSLRQRRLPIRLRLRVGLRSGGEPFANQPAILPTEKERPLYSWLCGGLPFNRYTIAVLVQPNASQFSTSCCNVT